MTYTTLQALIADYLARTDLTSKLPTFISLAEAYLFRELNIAALELSISGVTTGTSITLPDNTATVSRVTVSYAGRETALDYGVRSEQYSGAPTAYTLENGALKLDTNSAGYAYTLYYIPKIDALSNSNPTNWLLENAPDLYLCAGQLEGAKYVKDDAQISTLGAMLVPMLDSVQRLTRRTGTPARGSLQIKPRRG